MGSSSERTVSFGANQDAPATPTGECARSGRNPNARRILYGTAIVLMAWSWNVILHDPVYQAALFRLTSFGSPPPASAMQDVSLYEAKDPPLGTPFPTAGLGNVIRKKTPFSSPGYLLACIGDCSQCTSLSLPRLFTQTRQKHMPLLVISTGEEDRVQQTGAAYRQEGMDVAVYRDSHRKLSESLNCYYAGRLYFYTPDWRLRWREQDARIDNYLFTTGRFDRVMENTKP